MKTEQVFIASYDGREGCLLIMIALGFVAAGILFIGIIYLIFFKLLNTI